MDKIWWKKTDGARRFLTEAADILNAGRSVIFCLSERVPWLDTMREVLRDLLNRKFSGIRDIEILDAKEITKAPSEYVMKNFCPNKDGFRPYGEEAYAKFLANSPSSLLLERCLWIQNADATQAAAWFAFIADYHQFLNGRSGGVFIVETTEKFTEPSRAGVEIFSYAERITEYDCFAFNILTAAEFCRANNLTKQYLAELVTRLVGGNVELGAACMSRSDEFLRAPCEVFKSVSTNMKLAPQSDEDIDFAIWLTQLKLTFPLIETFRRNLIKQYYKAISVALPCYTDHNERIDRPEQVELGMMIHLVSEYQLWFDKPDWNELLYYRELRNKVAHLGILTFDELQELFEKNSHR